MKIRFFLFIAFFVTGAAIPVAATAFDVSYECNLSGVSTKNLANCPNLLDAGQSSTSALITDGSCNGSYCGARSDAASTAVIPIDAWGICRWIDNSNSNSLFVPFRTAKEWQMFLDAAPAINIQPVHCAQPYALTKAPSSTLATPPFPLSRCTSVTVQNPDTYGRTGVSTWPSPELKPSFTCHDGATTMQSLLQWDAGDSDTTPIGSLSWISDFHYSPDLSLTASALDDQSNSGLGISVPKGSSVLLSWVTAGVPGQTWSCTASNGWSGNMNAGGGSLEVVPDSPATYTLTCTDNRGLSSVASVAVDLNAACGPADGTETQSVPTKDLCSIGVPSQVTEVDASGGSHSWMWTCSSGITAPASCSTSIASVAVTLAPQQCTTTSTTPVDLDILLDASASMQPVVNASREALSDALSPVVASSNVSFGVVMIGGEGGYTPVNAVGKQQCPIGHIAPFGHPDVNVLTSNLGNVKAVKKTPIAGALGLASQDLTNIAHERAMLVISDGVETCAQSPVSATIQNLESRGIKIYGVQILHSGSSGGNTFQAMTAYNTVNGNNGTINVSDFSTALTAMLNETKSTCEISATIYDQSNNLVGSLTPESSLALDPGIYNVVYGLCGQTATKAVEISTPVQLSSGLECR